MKHVLTSPWASWVSHTPHGLLVQEARTEGRQRTIRLRRTTAGRAVLRHWEYEDLLNALQRRHTAYVWERYS